MVEQAGPLDKLPDQELAALCAQRPIHEEAWATFYQRFRGFVQSQVRWRRGGTAREIDDLTQEAFTKIFRVLPSFDPNKSQLKTYISHVIASVTIDYFRHNAASANTGSLTDEVGALQIRAAQNPEMLRIQFLSFSRASPARRRREGPSENSLSVRSDQALPIVRVVPVCQPLHETVGQARATRSSA